MNAMSRNDNCVGKFLQLTVRAGSSKDGTKKALSEVMDKELSTIKFVSFWSLK